MTANTPTTGKTYYFSNGDDGDGTIDKPFKFSQTKVNSALATGYNILLKRGETYYGSLIIGKSGTTTSRITVGAWGEGEAPVLTGFTSVNDWTYLGDGVYESEAITSAPALLNLVTVAGKPVGMGVYPNKDNGNGGYLTISSFSGKTSVTLPDLPTSPNWTDADLIIRGERWQLNRSGISKHDVNNHIIYYAGIVEPKKLFGCFITNSPKTLDRFGEWYWNPNTKKLMMFFGTATRPEVMIATKENGISSSGKSNISIRDISIEGFNNNSINFTGGSTKNELVNVNIKNSGYTGVYVTSSTFFSIENCSIDWSLNNGVDLYIGTDFASLRNTKITNTYMLAGMGGSGDHKGIAANIRGKSSIAEYNELRNCGFQGFYMGPVDDIIIQNNLVDGYGIVKDDCGAFYTYTGNTKLSLKGRVIRNNIARNGIGATYGTNQSAGSLFANSSFGFYGDLNASDILVTDNYFENAGRAVLFLHFAHNIKFVNNTCVNTQFMQYIVRDAARDNYDNTITGNVFLTSGNGYNAKFDNYANSAVSTLGVMDNNYFINPPTKATPWSVGKNNYNFSQWKGATHWDDHSTQKIISATDVIKTVYATKDSLIVDLEGYKWKDIKGNDFISPLPPYSGAVIIRGEKEAIPEPPKDNVEITISADKDSYTAGQSITLTAAIKNIEDSEISKVEFLVNGAHLRTDITANPWSARMDNLRARTYKYSATLTTKSGEIIGSNEVSITVI